MTEVRGHAPGPQRTAHRFAAAIRLVLLAMALIAATELLLFIFNSGVSRLPGFFAPNSDGTYRLASGTTTRYWHSGRIVTVTIDSDGHRIVPDAPAAASVTLHIVGDSQVFGWGLDDTETLPASLQQKLGAGVRIINHGLPGLGPLGYLNRVAEIPAHDPVIVVMTEMNDLQDAYGVEPSLTEHCGFIVLSDSIGRHIPCYVLTSHLVNAVMDLRDSAFGGRIPLPLGFNPHARISAKVLCHRVENSLMDYLRRRPGKSLLVTVPWEGELLADRLGAYAPALKHANAHTRLPGGITLLEALKDARLGAAAFLPDDHHLSARGAEIVASTLAQAEDWHALESGSGTILGCHYD